MPRTLLAALLATLAACVTTSSRLTPPAALPAPPSAPAPEDVSYDWHSLLVAPFGTFLKDIPLTLHEVLLFRDEVHGAAAADDAECYAADTPAPRFIGRTPDEYLLCFKQDRLSRVEASVRLATAQAPEVFATACAVWLKNAQPTTAAGPPAAATSSAGSCGGRSGVTRFSGRLLQDPETTLSITIDSTPEP